METAAEPFDRLIVVGEMRQALAGLMEIEGYTWNANGSLTLKGTLSGPAQNLYRTIRDRLEALGFTPFLRRRGDQDELVALPVVMARSPSRVVLPLVLFLLTVFSVLITGALYDYPNPITSDSQFLPVLWEIVSTPSLLILGVPFAATLLGILGTHEMGHYIVGRLRKAPVSLPYFIPLPPGIGIGTMGAVIVQREPMEDRRTILEVGIAGPLAGLVVAIPLLFYGLATSTVGSPPPGGYLQEGNSLIYLAAKWLVFGQILPSNGLDVQLNSIAWGAWIGLLVTMINLLPIGQLDGGHIAYALLGRRAEYLAYGMIGLCVVFGIAFQTFFWLIWAALSFFLIGPRHPAPLNDISQIGMAHKMLAVFGLIIFVLLLIPDPLRTVGV
ncbi:MAG: site-2 protease family protein [Chloroflexi bacterium AL-W]|nr:site-2 protease family protein [Chloroflexi bacterium AL-N1]NOK68863.1 site-2 protease family protein [Chloroflexi bacterium AL-N10]NOK76847.1 site-2 protease family protein [Chloroflexi bacterium AL-N5]NOK82766.1 site-2 protease family protein [Chloroflexi bacterium AL-W]NOK90704.1 site-2 protease family protein [Chloroflexi bacterium AL-N15]